MRRRVLVLAFVVTTGCSDDGTDASPTTEGADDGATTMAAGSTAAVDDGGGSTGTSVSGPDDDDADGVDDGPITDDGIDESGDDDGGHLGLPPENGGLDYQLGGAYPPPEGVAIVSRDRQDPPEEGLYNICYVNGFQIQPAEEDFWMSEHPELILVDGSGNPVIDPDWDEML